LILDGLTDESAVVVRAACEAASALDLQDAHPRFLDLLRAAEPATREEAIRALGSLWKAEDFEIVLTVFRSEHEATVRKEAAWVLRRHASQGTWKQLFDAWRMDDVHRHRLWACELAGEYGGREVLPYLRELGRDQDGLVRRAAEQAAQRLEAV